MITTGNLFKTGNQQKSSHAFSFKKIFLNPASLTMGIISIALWAAPSALAQEVQPSTTDNAEALGLDPLELSPPPPAAAEPVKPSEPLAPPAETNAALTAAEQASVNSPEAYEAQLKKKRENLTTPHWSFNILVEPRAFRVTEWRAAPTDRTIENLKFFGVILQGERFLFKKFGMTSIGAELGFYGAGGNDDFSRTMPALMTAGGSIAYQFHYFTGQWVVPYVQGSMSMARYSYNFNHAGISGFKVLPRADLGLLFYLNFLDRDSAGDMYGNYGILRTYLVTAVTMTDDRTPNKNFNLEGQTLRVGLRFEF